MAEPEDPQRQQQEQGGKAEKQPKAAEPDSPRDSEPVEDLDVDDDSEITERVRGGRSRAISIPH